jgi:tRNA (mo5U34)-methyltransferase
LEGAADIYFGMGITGLSVLDVGAWDGFFSFEAERRGAADVLAVDQYVWRAGGPGNRAAFDLCREVLDSHVKDKIIDVPRTTKENVGEFDIVLFNGIVYHILDPIHALINMSKIAREVLTVETWIDNIEVPRAVMNFFPAEEMPLGHPQNGWGPNSLLMHALLKRIGFETVLEWPTPTHESQRSIFLGFKPGHRFGSYVKQHIDKAQPRLVGTPPDYLRTIERLITEREAVRNELEAVRSDRNVIRREMESARSEIASVRLDLDDARRNCDALRQSTSWRLTKPLRMIRNGLSHR